MKSKQTNKQKNKKTIEDLRQKCNSELTDLVVGPMNLSELSDALASTVLHRSPEYIVILIEKRKNLKKYHSTIYITTEDFVNYR
ncbi:MAG: hypothetical protein AABX91_02165 [Nanoarchaeota archaeon]